VAADGTCIVVCFDTPRRGQFLMVRHARRGWELPGGRIETGESASAAAEREFLEETGRHVRGLREVPALEGYAARVFVGVVGATAVAQPADPAIRETRWVAHLDEVEPLSFPDDPYDRIGQSLARPLRRRDGDTP
jgi:8-oxo-dGTP diphosphatase